MVLLKDFNKEGFIFYTNSESKKGKSIKQNNNNTKLHIIKTDDINLYELDIIKNVPWL